MWEKKGRCLSGKQFWRGGKKKKRGGISLVTHFIYKPHFPEACEGFSVCVDEVVERLQSNLRAKIEGK